MAIGASVRAVGDWENDRRKPRNRLGALEDILEIDLSGEEADRSPPPRLSDATRQMMREELGDELAAQLIAQADHMASGRAPAAGGGRPSGPARTDRRSAG